MKSQLFLNHREPAKLGDTALSKIERLGSIFSLPNRLRKKMVRIDGHFAFDNGQDALTIDLQWLRE